jgi:hypothetical protein
MFIVVIQALYQFGKIWQATASVHVTRLLLSQVVRFQPDQLGCTFEFFGVDGLDDNFAGFTQEIGNECLLFLVNPVKAQALTVQLGSSATTGVFSAALLGDIVIPAVPYAVVLDVAKIYGEGWQASLSSTSPTPSLSSPRRASFQLGLRRVVCPARG